MAATAETLAAAVKHHRAGRLQTAEHVCRQILEADPNHAGALHLLGLIAHQVGKQEVAVDCIRLAIAANPHAGSFHFSLGAAYEALQKLPEAVSSYRRAVQLMPKLAEAHNNLGNILRSQGKLDAAVAAYRQAVEIKPGYAAAHSNLGNGLNELGKFDEAASSCRRALQLQPDLFQAHNNLGKALAGLEEFDQAAGCYRRALRIKPDHAPAHKNLGDALKELEKLDEAAAHYRRAVQIKPDYTAAHCNLGNAYGRLGKHAEAAACYDRALEIEPNLAAAHNDLAALLVDQGKFDEALDHYRMAIERDPEDPVVRRDLSASKRFTEADRPEIEQTEAILEKKNLPQEMQSHLHFALGKMYDDCRQWDRAFAHYREANRLADLPFNGQLYIDGVSALIDIFSSTFLEHPPALGPDSEVPVFIVGVPRSGTTLVEQIISSHPSVLGAGELDEMHAISQKVSSLTGCELPYPYSVPLMDHDCAARLADEYLSRVKELGKEAIRVTDKMPSNFFHLGLISLILPEARIIHCRRHPLDVCLSCYFQNFAKRLDFAYDLHTAGVYYRQYERLMDHWRAVLPKQIFEVDYERLVENQEEVSRRLIHFCGLDWHSNCLEFHKNSRSVHTASHWQVRQPIYTRSVARWKNYEKFLDPLKEALGRASRPFDAKHTG